MFETTGESINVLNKQDHKPRRTTSSKRTARSHSHAQRKVRALQRFSELAQSLASESLHFENAPPTSPRRCVREQQVQSFRMSLGQGCDVRIHFSIANNKTFAFFSANTQEKTGRTFPNVPHCPLSTAQVEK